MKQSTMTASKLRVILSVIVVFLIGLSAVGFYFGQDKLRTLAVSVSHKIADSKVSGGDVQSLKKLQAELTTRQGIVNKANSIMASSQDYQTQTIKDLDKYATDANIVISNYSFVQPAAAAAPTAGAATSTAPAPGSTSVTVTLTSPLAYTKLLKFMTAIESNLPKMQVSSVNLGRVAGGDRDAIKTEQLTIEVYTQ